MSKRRYVEVSVDSGEDLLRRMQESMGDPALFKAVLEQALPSEFDPKIVDFIASMSQYVPKPTRKILPSLPVEAVQEALRCLDADDIDAMRLVSKSCCGLIHRLSDDERPLRHIEKVHIGEEEDECWLPWGEIVDRKTQDQAFETIAELNAFLSSCSIVDTFIFEFGQRLKRPELFTGCYKHAVTDLDCRHVAVGKLYFNLECTASVAQITEAVNAFKSVCELRIAGLPSKRPIDNTYDMDEHFFRNLVECGVRTFKLVTDDRIASAALLTFCMHNAANADHRLVHVDHTELDLVELKKGAIKAMNILVAIPS